MVIEAFLQSALVAWFKNGFVMVEGTVYHTEHEEVYT